MALYYYCLVLFVLISGRDVLSEPIRGPVENFEVKIDEKTGGFQLYLSDKLWFNSADLWVRNNGKWYSTQDKSLILNSTSTDSGRLDWGPMQVTNFQWKSSDGSFHFSTYTVVFQEVPVVIFGQQWDDGGTHTTTGNDDDTISTWPTLKIEDMPDIDRGYATWSGGMTGNIVIGKLSSSISSIYNRVDGGFPLVIFDSELENTLVISPQNTFMSGHQVTWKPQNYTVPVWGSGIIGKVDMIPKGYSMETLVVAGQNVTGTMEKWGKLLRIRYKKEDHYRLADFTINYLGYYTDNGACYYYYTGEYDNYEDALVAVKENAVKNGIPYQYLQLDSWWYYKGVGGGVKNWAPMPDVFPHGLQYLSNKTHWPIVAHNRYFSPDTVYAKQNGGQFNFIIDTGHIALPNDPDFWRYLLSTARDEWNLRVYEQDWLLTEFGGLKELEMDLNLGKTWLDEMGEAAKELGLTIQYCMAWTRHVLQSVMIPVVTQTRVSGDYHPGNTQWKIGYSTILVHALGLAAFKDDFHTLSNEPNCRFNPEPYPALETFVAALSGGPVGPSDTATSFNKTLIMATCMADGLLLKPSQPAMSLDSTFLYHAFGKGGPNGEVVASYSEVSGYTWYYVLAVDNKDKYDLKPTELPPSESVKPKSLFPESVALQYNLDGTIKPGFVSIKDNSGKIPLDTCDRDNFEYWVIAPVFPGTGGALLGELDKIVSVADKRILTIIVLGDEYVMKLRGAPGETVNMSTFDMNSGRVKTAVCTIGSDGTGTFAFSDASNISC